MEIFTIGFTKKNAAGFFGILRSAGIRQLLDVRLNNTSQLAAFTKRDDLPFFLDEICNISYTHEPLLAPSQEILSAYRKDKGEWAEYERQFLTLMHEREVEKQISPQLFDLPTVLLCSEPTAGHCHRRLVLEYLEDKWGNIDIVHL